MTLKNKTKKIISSLLIVSMLLPTVLLSKPKQADAQWLTTDLYNGVINTVNGVFSKITSASTLTNTATTLKNYAMEIGKQALMLAAKALLAKMTQATINWINSDFHGSPLFLENPQSFFNDIAKFEIKNLVNTFGYDPNRFPFGKQFALNTIDSYKRQLEDNAQYTLSKVINDPALLERYRNDFNAGGWNGFLINTQYPQNNYLGFQMLASEELARKLEGTVQNAAQKVQTALQQGMGFLSPQTCPSNPAYNNGVNEFQRPAFQPTVAYNPPTMSQYGGDSPEFRAALSAYNDRFESAKAVQKSNWAIANTCPGGLVSTTPGSVAANQVFNALNVPFLSTALDGALGNSLAAIFDALINKLIGTGLDKLSSTINPGPSNDNWSYDGNTLSGSAPLPGSTPAGGDLNIPQNVSVTVGQTSSIVISGGTAGPQYASGGYSIQNQPNGAVATAQISISGSFPQLSVTGVAPGQTSVTVRDSSIPSKIVTVVITVSAVGDIMVSPANISAGLNPITAIISGGQEPYLIQTGPNESVAIAVLSGTNLIVTGITPGTTSIRIQDSSVPAKTVIVPIKVVLPNSLNIPSVSVNIGQIINTQISGGTAPYTVTDQQDITVANAEILSATPDMLKVTGIAPGTSTVTVKDSSNPFQTIPVVITTLAPLGNCYKALGGDAAISQQMPKANCDSLGGSWSPLPPSSTH